MRSTLAAEACALTDALHCFYFIANDISDIIYSHNPSAPPFPIVSYTDNDGLQKNVYSTTMADEFRLRIDLAAIKEMITNKELLKLNWVPTSKQLADCLTKKGGNSLALLKVLESGLLL